MNDILDDLIINKEHYKELLSPFFKMCKDALEKENQLFTEDILKQFQDTTRWLLADDIHKRFNINIVDAYILLENVEVKRYLE